MLTYNSAVQTGTTAAIEIDVVRLTQERFDILKHECQSDEGQALGAFIAQYDFSTCIHLYRGKPENHEAFMAHLNKLM